MGLGGHHYGGYVHSARRCKRIGVHSTFRKVSRDCTREVYDRREAKKWRNCNVVNVLRGSSRDHRLRCNSPTSPNFEKWA